MIRFSEGGLMAGLAAYRDIEPGEEITISCENCTLLFLDITISWRC